MICIVDSGSTKADWAVLTKDGDLFQSFTTPGMNPVVGFSEEAVTEKLQSFIHPEDMDQVHKIDFFGAGCAENKSKDIIRKYLKGTFKPGIKISVSTDLHAAAMACYGNKPGYIGILGTGSSAAYFNGQKIKKRSRSLGYLISDQGSGFDIGRKILRAYYHRQMPEDIVEEFEQFYHKELKDIYRNIYQSDNPNSFIASFTRFLSEINTEKFVADILAASFDDYFRNIVSQLGEVSKHHKISFAGSIAYHFAYHVKKSAKRFGFVTGQILERPIHRLVFQYRNKLLNS